MATTNVYPGDSLRLWLGKPLYIIDSIYSNVDETLFQIMRGVRNWWSVLFVYLGVSKSANAHLKNGVETRVTKNGLGKLVSLSELANIPEQTKKSIGLSIVGNKASLKINGRQLTLDLEVANAVAIELYTKEHSMINVKGMDVVDVGAYLDDTSIYYALSEGAKHVYAFEPFPYIYNTAVRNVKANKLTKLITTYNIAVSGSSGSVSLDKDYTSFDKVDSNRSASGKGAVKVVSLDSVVRSLKIKDGALKVDCEGCEYSIFLKSSRDALRAFKRIHIEYHYGYKDLVERLQIEGFSVKYTKPAYHFMGLGSKPMLKGHIVAERKPY